MLENIISLLRGEILIESVKTDERTIIEVSFYDKQHGINSEYPCINTCISDNNGEEWFTTTFFTWTDFINEVKAYISYYEAESKNTNNVYIKECDFL